MLMALPGVCTENIPLPTALRPDVEVSRKKGIRVYLILFVLQLCVGIGCLTCAIAAIKFDASKTGIPYYTGGLMIACLMLFSSLLAFRIYNKGPSFSVDDAAKKDVTCALNCHHTFSFLLLFGTVVGLALLWMYGLCFGDENDTCSYGESHVRENRIIAGVNCMLGIAALASSGIGVCLIRKYGQAFGLETEDRWRQNTNINSTSLRRTSRMQNVFSLNGSCDLNSALEDANGYTNYGFDPLPPYTPTPQVQDNHVSLDISPRDPPPPYCEVSDTDITLEVNSHL